MKTAVGISQTAKNKNTKIQASLFCRLGRRRSLDGLRRCFYYRKIRFRTDRPKRFERIPGAMQGTAYSWYRVPIGAGLGVSSRPISVDRRAVQGFFCKAEDRLSEAMRRAERRLRYCLSFEREALVSLLLDFEDRIYAKKEI